MDDELEVVKIMGFVSRGDTDLLRKIVRDVIVNVRADERRKCAEEVEGIYCPQFASGWSAGKHFGKAVRAGRPTPEEIAASRECSTCGRVSKCHPTSSCKTFVA